MSNRIILVLAALLIIAGGVFAGGGNQTPAPTTTAPAASTTPAPTTTPVSQSPFSNLELQGVEVLFWHQHSRAREEAMNRIIAGFNDTNPYGITVKGEYAGGYGDIYNKMISGLAGGVVPNLVVGYQNQAGAYMLADGLVDIEPYVVDPEFGLTATEKADFIEGIYNSDYNAQFDNQRLGFPPNRSMEVLYYNADWLEELGFAGPPKTWEEFERMAIAATDASTGKYGYPISTDASNLFSLAISLGGDGYLNGSGTDYEFNTPEIRNALSMMKRLYDAGAAKKIAEAYGNQTDFGNRISLFSMGSTSGLPYYGSAVEASEAGSFAWSVAPMPTNQSRPVMNMYGASVSIPKTSPENQLAAWLFLKYLTSPEPQRAWTVESGYFPVRASVRNSLTDYVSENPQFGDAFDILLNSQIKTEPPFASYEEVRRSVSSTFNEILDGADISSALDRLTKEANEINQDMLP